MIKKCLKGLCILGLTLLPISFSNGAFNDVSCQTFTDASTMVVYDNTILTFRNGNFTTNRFNESIEHVIWLTNSNYGTDNQHNQTSSFFSYYNGLPYIGAFGTTYDGNTQGFPQNVCVSSLSGFDISTYGSSLSCNSQSISSFLNAGNIQGGSICYPDTTNNYSYALYTYCFYDDSYAYCFKITSYKNSPNLQVLTLSGSLGVVKPLTVSRLKAFEWSKSPFGFNPPSYETDNTTLVNTGDVIDYFEQNLSYKFTPDMCYIGTTDLSSNYESAIPYYQGSGYTIYEFYSQLYGNTYKLSDLDTWLNSWLVNFDTFWLGGNRYIDGTPRYVLRYNGIGDLQIDYSNLTNPFLNNKSAYYFMGSTACDGYRGYDGCGEISHELAVYCYNKTNPSGNITYDVNSGIQQNINQWVVNKYQGQSMFSSGNIIIEGDNWHGTPLDYFSGGINTDFNGFFSGSFNRFKGVFSDLNPNSLSFGSLPSYIITFLLALILFRFLSH